MVNYIVQNMKQQKITLFYYSLHFVALIHYGKTMAQC